MNYFANAIEGLGAKIYGVAKPAVNESAKIIDDEIKFVPVQSHSAHVEKAIKETTPKVSHALDDAIKGTGVGLGIVMAGAGIGVATAGIQTHYMKKHDNLSNSLRKMEPF